VFSCKRTGVTKGEVTKRKGMSLQGIPTRFHSLFLTDGHFQVNEDLNLTRRPIEASLERGNATSSQEIPINVPRNEVCIIQGHRNSFICQVNT